MSRVHRVHRHVLLVPYHNCLLAYSWCLIKTVCWHMVGMYLLRGLFWSQTKRNDSSGEDGKSLCRCVHLCCYCFPWRLKYALSIRCGVPAFTRHPALLCQPITSVVPFIDVLLYHVLTGRQVVVRQRARHMRKSFF